MTAEPTPVVVASPVASIVATSGHEPRPGVIALLPEIFVFAIAFIGAAVFSTSSGLKIHRKVVWLINSTEALGGIGYIL